MLLARLDHSLFRGCGGGLRAGRIVAGTAGEDDECGEEAEE